MTKDSKFIQWGMINDGMGFIQVKTMWLYADLGLSQGLIDSLGFVDAYFESFNKMYEGDYIDKEVQGVAKVMDGVMHDLEDAQSIIIDMRFNGGGQDAVSLEILNRFVPQRLQIATQKIKYGNLHTATIPVFVDGSENAFTRPVYVLTSQQTGSAAEVFLSSIYGKLII